MVVGLPRTFTLICLNTFGPLGGHVQSLFAGVIESLFASGGQSYGWERVTDTWRVFVEILDIRRLIKISIDASIIRVAKQKLRYLRSWEELLLQHGLLGAKVDARLFLPNLSALSCSWYICIQINFVFLRRIILKGLVYICRLTSLIIMRLERDRILSTGIPFCFAFVMRKSVSQTDFVACNFDLISDKIWLVSI